MRRLPRLRLSPSAEEALRSLAGRVSDAATAKAVWKARRDARAGELTFMEITAKLAAMASGNKRCMYCEASAGTDIEHFWPKAAYHGRTFVWSNYVLACSGCNSDHKGDRFPLDTQGGPELLDPTADEVAPHLTYTPSNSQYEPETPRGKASIEGYGLRRPDLQRGRATMWGIYQSLLVDWNGQLQRGDRTGANRVEDDIVAADHASVLVALVRIALSPAAPVLVACGVLRGDVVDVLNRRPEVRQWIAGW